MKITVKNDETKKMALEAEKRINTSKEIDINDIETVWTFLGLFNGTKLVEQAKLDMSRKYKLELVILGY